MGGIVLGVSCFLLGVLFVLHGNPYPATGQVFVAIGTFTLLLALHDRSPG
jgi:hypothetical protein